MLHDVCLPTRVEQKTDRKKVNLMWANKEIGNIIIHTKWEKMYQYAVFVVGQSREIIFVFDKKKIIIIFRND